MRPYGQYCPVAKGAELLGDRWTLLIVRELLYGPQRFSDIERGLPRISRSVLSQRLKALCCHGIVERFGTAAEAGYRFTPAGEELRPVVKAIGDWVGKWIMADPQPAELDPTLLALWLSRNVDSTALPHGRVVVELRFRGAGRTRAWLVFERQGVSMCLQYPGFPIDLVVTGTLTDLYRIFMGRSTLTREQRAGRVSIEGAPRYRRVFTRCMTWAEAAPVVREARRTNRGELPVSS